MSKSCQNLIFLADPKRLVITIAASPVKLELHLELDPQSVHTIDEGVNLVPQIQHTQYIFHLVGKYDRHHLENEHSKTQDHEVLCHTQE
jgi:hypothetical protein